MHAYVVKLYKNKENYNNNVRRMVSGEERGGVIGKGNIQTFWDAGHVLFLHLSGTDTEIYFAII